MIGYYVHHQGLGHRQRMRAITAHLDRPFTVLSSLDPQEPDDPSWVSLPWDNTAESVDPTANGTLHWVPRYDDGLRRRMARIARWIDETEPDLMVVDVSVEVALLCRLLGVPTVVVAMRGDRFDRGHRTAYDGAHAMLAPWAAEFAVVDWPESWRSKTFHSGAISRFGDRRPPATEPHDGPRRVLVLWGSGGDGAPVASVAAAAAATPSWTWRIAGRPPLQGTPMWDQLCWADVVVTHGGQGAVAEVAAAGRPAVVIAEQRPHGEQAATVDALGRAGLAVALQAWPDPGRWPGLLATAQSIGGGGWSRWAPPGAAERAAGFLSAVATQARTPSPDTRGTAAEPVA